MKLIILLAGMTRSGVDFFQSLLDRHTEIAQLPGFFYVDDFLKKIINIKKPEEIAKIFVESYEEYFDSRLSIIERHNYLGEKKNEFYTVDKVSFLNNFVELSQNKFLDKKQIIENIHLAYSMSSGEDIKKKKIIILQIHHLFRIDSIKDMNFDLIFTIRDPIASHSSYVQNLSTFKSKTSNAWQLNYHMERNFSHLIKANNFKKKMYVVKLESLHRENIRVLKKFCNIYKIKFEEILKFSTFHGKLWWGDSVGKRDLSGVNKEFSNKINYSSFFKNDIYIIEYFLANFIKTYGYNLTAKNKTESVNKYFFLKADYFILKLGFKNINLKNIIFCFYYLFKRSKILNKKFLDNFKYPEEIR